MFSIKYVFPTKSLTANNDPLNVSKIIPNVSDKVIFSFFQTKAKHSKTQSLLVLFRRIGFQGLTSLLLNTLLI